jgi:hypothetical protein
MAINFPQSPSIGQIYTLPTGESWRWNGSAWSALGGSIITIPGQTGPQGENFTFYHQTETPTGTITEGSLWYNHEKDALYMHIDQEGNCIWIQIH